MAPNLRPSRSGLRPRRRLQGPLRWSSNGFRRTRVVHRYAHVMTRIRKTRWKLVYIVIGILLLGFNGLVLSPAFPPLAAAVAANVLVLLLFLGGVRSFRGPGEPVKPPRAWWRMTSRPRAGFVVGSLLVLSFVNGVFFAVSGSGNFSLSYAVGTVVDGSLAFLFLRSSIQLRKFPPETVPDHVEAPRWKPIKL